MKRIGNLNAFLQRKPWIYRIETLERFYEILESGELIFVRPRMWSDPLENIIFNASLVKDGKPYIHPANEKIYGQCWSWQNDSYALWQIYTVKNEKGKLKKSTGVRMVTRLSNLTQLSQKNKGSFWYGLVEYKSKKDLDALKKDPEFLRGLARPDISEEHIKTLLVKRRSYQYESEVRLLAVPEHSRIDKSEANLCRLKLNPVEFITSVLFDPVMDKEEFNDQKARLTEKFGFRPSQVKMSSLAQENKFRFDLDKA